VSEIDEFEEDLARGSDLVKEVLRLVELGRCWSSFSSPELRVLVGVLEREREGSEKMAGWTFELDDVLDVVLVRRLCEAWEMGSPGAGCSC
jgi:hypothetical protein